MSLLSIVHMKRYLASAVISIVMIGPAMDELLASLQYFETGSCARTFALGVWLMAAPAVLGYGDPAQTNDHIVGPLVVACATIALWEVTRPLRWVNLALGVWLLVAPWVLGYLPPPLVNSLGVGVLIIGFALVRGETQSRFGGGWSSWWAKS